MRRETLSYTTAANGSATATGPAVFGKLYAVEYLPGSTDTGATITLTCEGASSQPMLTKASAGTSNAWFYPRALVNGVADGAALTGTAGGDRTLPLMAGYLKLVVASGGNAKSGSVVVYIE